MSDIQINCALIRERIKEAARLSGRDNAAIKLVAATKTMPYAAIRAAVACGIDTMGENRVQELVAKHAEHAYDGVDLHFIGHLQTNKVRQVVGLCSLIQSVGSMHLAEEIDRIARQRKIIQDILIEINIGCEDSKSGIAAETAEAFLASLSALENIQVRGVMTIPPVSADSGQALHYLTQMKRLFDAMAGKRFGTASMDYLSMGMSNDYYEAIIAGANMVRLGTAIFGKRG